VTVKVSSVRSSTETVNGFFHPGQFHLEPANLRKQFGFTRRLRLLFTHLLPTKEAAATVEQLLLPLGDVGRMHRVFTGKLAERLLLFGCFEGEAELELREDPSWQSRPPKWEDRPASRERMGRSKPFGARPDCRGQQIT
jgi:hypothetical protein